MPINENTAQIIRQIRQDFAGQALTPFQAKLYSQNLRLSMGQEGLPSFNKLEAKNHLEEAVMLIECALIERDMDANSNWAQGVKRAAEILEWLSQQDLQHNFLDITENTESLFSIPLSLLAAAAYQLAGYPALALGHLQRVPNEAVSSTLLKTFLSGDFPGTVEVVRIFWRQYSIREAPQIAYTEEIRPASSIEDIFKRHVIMCIGTICAYLRTGKVVMVARSLAKLNNLASLFLHSGDPFSWLLARLTAETCWRYTETCLWPHITNLQETSSENAGRALTQFARVAFNNRRAIVWPAQAAGIRKLQENNSFVLCTPTGSGKTVIATLASIQSLYAASPLTEFININVFDSSSDNLVLYLVPSRALAAEVEARLAKDLRGISAEPAIVTGLYGGIDWGPTDAWIDREKPTIVICTFEKADALLRFLGPLFISRIRLVVIDEAHMVELERESTTDLENATSRPYRLEQLVTRLLYARDIYNFRVIALSAVAAKAAPALARWLSGDVAGVPVTSDHRSTRQMLGRLLVNERGAFEIVYDLMNGRSLEFEDERQNKLPYVHNPFPALPEGLNLEAGPEVQMRAPTLWAALHLAAERTDGSLPSVLISVTQQVEGFAKSCLEILESWSPDLLPVYRITNQSNEKWMQCLAVAADYFSEQSIEYRLLRHGIAVHHGKMPALLARRLKEVIDLGIIRVIIATSTLSEGVNMPINYLLLPSVCRKTSHLHLQEFTNLIGRAGRPGYGTEGHALIVLPALPAGANPNRHGRQWRGYMVLKNALEDVTRRMSGNSSLGAASSPLTQLLYAIEAAWSQTTGGGQLENFERWLEQTAVVGDTVTDSNAIRRLDSLDSFILSSLQEVEDLQFSELSQAQIEQALIRIWQHTYAYASGVDEERLQRIWLARSRTIKSRYPDSSLRRSIYRTSLTPRSAIALINASDSLRARLLDGISYALRSREERFLYICEVIELLSAIPSFKLSRTLGRNKDFGDWRKLLRWWIAKDTLSQDEHPKPNQITTWYAYVHHNFIYLANWGLGSALGLLLQNQDADAIAVRTIDDWPRSGLPWIAFWLKELLTWGTMDPVVAFLLARGGAANRKDAKSKAREYYTQLGHDLTIDEKLNPKRIRAWAEASRVHAPRNPTRQTYSLPAHLAHNINAYVMDRIYVSPLESGDRLKWIDPAGHVVAGSVKPENWPENPAAFDFELVVRDAQIIGEAYLQHQ